MAIKVAIVDDEKHASETLEWQLKKAAVHCDIIGVFNDSREAASALPRLGPDLLFLDIEMPSLNGFQLLDAINMPDLQVIFTTAYDQFAVKAFRVNAIDYLLKPIDNDELDKALRKTLRETAQVDMVRLKSIFDGFSAAKHSVGKLALPSIHGVDFIHPDLIIYCQSESNYTRIYMTGNQKLLVSKTLKEIEQMLPTANFLRIHNSYVANLERVSKLLRSGGGTLMMENGAELKVSRQRKTDLLTRLSLHPNAAPD
jgi:two-component system LytT family response regulator